MGRERRAPPDANTLAITAETSYTSPVSESYVIVHRSYDPIVIEHLGEMLREAGIAARVLGTRSASLIGVGSVITELHIGVPESQAGEATEFLEDYFAGEGAALLADAGLLDPDDDGEVDDRAGDRDRPLRPIFAGVAVVLTFGIGHLYARRPVTAVMLAAGQLATFVVFTQFSFDSAAIAWGGAYGTVIIYDLVGAQLAVRAYNRGVRRGVGAQLGAGVLALGLAAAVAFTAGTKVPQWQPRHLFDAGYDEPVRRLDYRQHGDDYDPWIDPFSAPVPRQRPKL